MFSGRGCWDKGRRRRNGQAGWGGPRHCPITGQEDSLATGLDTWEGRRAVPEPGGPARPAQPQGAPFPVRQEMPRGFETLAPLPCLSSPHFSRVSLQSWGTPLAGEAEVGPAGAWGGCSHFLF